MLVTAQEASQAALTRTFYPPTTRPRNARGNIIRGRTGYYQSKNSLRRITIRHRGSTMSLLMLS